MAEKMDRFGNPIDTTVGYARGRVLRSTDDEVTKTLHARHLVRERVAAGGSGSVYDLSGMNRGAALDAEDVKFLTSHVPFFARFEGEAEPVAIRHMGGHPERHAALILNRVSAANFLALTTLLRPGDRVVALAPGGGTTHPSVVRPVAMVGAALEEVHDPEALERVWAARGLPRLLVVTPISASKHHLDLAAFAAALRLARSRGVPAYVDDAHMASRIGFFDEPRTFAVGDPDLAVCSADEHVAGPRAGVLVGRKKLVTAIRSRAYELGLEAQASQYVGVLNALRDFDAKPIAAARVLAREVLEILQERYGAARVYLGGPGVSITGEDAWRSPARWRVARVCPPSCPWRPARWCRWRCWRPTAPDDRGGGHAGECASCAAHDVPGRSPPGRSPHRRFARPGPTTTRRGAPRCRGRPAVHARGVSRSPSEAAPALGVLVVLSRRWRSAPSGWTSSCPSPKPHPTRLTTADALATGEGTPRDWR